MYCPRCSQQQVSDDIRFCSRCGFKLDAVADLLLTDGVPLKSGKDFPLAATLIAAAMLFISILAVAMSLTYVGPASSQMVMFSIILALISSIFLLSCKPWRLVRKLFSDDTGHVKAAKQSPHAMSGLTTQVKSTTREMALPPAQSIPVTGFSSQRVNTAEMAQPSSITEHTTRLLDEQ